MGSCAVALFTNFFTGSEQAEIEKECRILLDSCSFLFEDLNHDDPLKCFQFNFLLHVLTIAYLPSIKGFVHIPALKTEHLASCGMIGILGLSSAAVTICFFCC